MDKRILLFAPAAYNLAETSRMVEIAKGVRNHPEAAEVFEIRLISEGGQFEELVKDNGCRTYSGWAWWRRLQPGQSLLVMATSCPGLVPSPSDRPFQGEGHLFLVPSGHRHCHYQPPDLRRRHRDQGLFL